MAPLGISRHKQRDRAAWDSSTVFYQNCLLFLDMKSEQRDRAAWYSNEVLLNLLQRVLSPRRLQCLYTREDPYHYREVQNMNTKEQIFYTSLQHIYAKDIQPYDCNYAQIFNKTRQEKNHTTLPQNYHNGYAYEKFFLRRRIDKDCKDVSDH
uniref:Uncharacterized protein n=1 Tax=Glossina palpalis gambiensis TaxID=67801 RepID=A0A1B0BW72_9MUSC